MIRITVSHEDSGASRRLQVFTLGGEGEPQSALIEPGHSATFNLDEMGGRTLHVTEVELEPIQLRPAGFDASQE